METSTGRLRECSGFLDTANFFNSSRNSLQLLPNLAATFAKNLRRNFDLLDGSSLIGEKVFEIWEAFTLLGEIIDIIK